ncbi:MAG: hypothetical protein LBQ10_02115 [Desulfovibrio sp.]|nr:hypothetical protein [Desulfovibrio sp.]
MAHTLQIWIKATLCLDVGMAHKVACLRFFATKNTFFAHHALHTQTIRKTTTGLRLIFVENSVIRGETI